jgi:magnesium transporter
VRTLFNAEKGRQPVSVSSVSSCLANAQEAFWLDIEAPDGDDYRLLEDTFHFHPLTIEDIQHQNQRPKLDTYEGYHFVVLFVAAFDGADVSFREHHLYLAPRYLVTVHQEPEPAFEKLHERINASPAASLHSSGFLAYLVVDVLVDVAFSALTSLDEAVDQLQDEILVDASTAHLVNLQRLKHGVTELRRIFGAQRDMFQRLVSHSLAQYDAETTAYYRDVYDHILRQSETVDSLRDLLTGAMDVYLSTVSNRLNLTMKALTVIASVFLPLTFLTGFFGMNFGWLVSRIDSPYAFAIGLTVMLISIVFQLWLFRRRGWI